MTPNFGINKNGGEQRVTGAKDCGWKRLLSYLLHWRWQNLDQGVHDSIKGIHGPAVQV